MEGILDELDGEETLTLSPSEQNYRDVYRLMLGAVVPRPIAFVSSLSAIGVRNLAPFSFFTVASAHPPVLCICPLLSTDGKKDTLRNIEATREFVVNIVTEDIADRMNITSADFPPEVDEFVKSGLTPIPSTIVRPPRVQECKVNFECTLQQIITVSTLPMGGSVVLGEVLAVHVDDSVMDGPRIDPDKLNAIGRMGGASYTRTRDRFDLVRPRTGELKQ
jgi:flavin reductase (DIM6/NTAB) family NADH-FMN oxidoreductase RutF